MIKIICRRWAKEAQIEVKWVRAQSGEAGQDLGLTRAIAYAIVYACTPSALPWML